MNIEVRLLDSRLPAWGFPRFGSDLAAGLDLFACLDTPLTLAPGDPAALVPSGLAIRIGDPDWCGVIAPRSGLGHRGLVLGNTVGIIDADYEGQILVSAWNRNPPGGEVITLAPGDRLAQMLFVRVTRPEFRIVETFDGGGSRRGASGFGSTGTGSGLAR